jgi:hypothetical protein
MPAHFLTLSGSFQLPFNISVHTDRSMDVINLTLRLYGLTQALGIKIVL